MWKRPQGSSAALRLYWVDITAAGNTPGQVGFLKDEGKKEKKAHKHQYDRITACQIFLNFSHYPTSVGLRVPGRWVGDFITRAQSCTGQALSQLLTDALAAPRSQNMVLCPPNSSQKHLIQLWRLLGRYWVSLGDERLSYPQWEFLTAPSVTLFKPHSRATNTLGKCKQNPHQMPFKSSLFLIKSEELKQNITSSHTNPTSTVS